MSNALAFTCIGRPQIQDLTNQGQMYNLSDYPHDTHRIIMLEAIRRKPIDV